MLKKIRICAKCERMFCSHNAGYYTANSVYENWMEFIRSRIRILIDILRYGN
jgi:hypothetical protein